MINRVVSINLKQNVENPEDLVCKGEYQHKHYLCSLCSPDATPKSHKYIWLCRCQSKQELA